MAKFKIGDRVKILDGKNIELYTGGWNYLDMKDFIGEVGEITKVVTGLYGGRVAYSLKDMPFNWDERGLELYKEEEKVWLSFITNENYRIDKTNNTKIPTIETVIHTNTGIVGSATCDKKDYDERQGVIEALANGVCYGNFDKAYRYGVKEKEAIDKSLRTCEYCGRVFDTISERKTHEEWHIERKKARRERYLLRKRAKEIAFEEQAQKMAKEIIADEGRKKT